MLALSVICIFSFLSLTQELDDRGLLSGGSEVPSYEASYRQRSRRGMEMKRRSSRLRKRAGSVAVSCY